LDEEDGGWQSYFLDLTTGEVSLAKVPGQQLAKLDDGTLLPYIAIGVWDPLEPAYLYAMRTDYDEELDYVSSIWRIQVETLVGTQILPPDSDGLYSITPDGQNLLAYRWDEEEGDRHPARYSPERHTWTPLPEYMHALHTYAPNGELVAGFPYARAWNTTVLAIMNLATARLVNAVNPTALPHGEEQKYPCFLGAPTWLFNSAGVLVNVEFTIESTEGDLTEHTIWHVGINAGEVSAIATGVIVIANSQNGRHWLLQHGQQFYVMAVDDTSSE